MPSAPSPPGRERLRLARGSFLRGVLTLATGTAGVQALYLVSLPVLTRLYSVPQLGDLAVFQALLAVLLVVSALRYDVAVFVAPGDDEAARVLGVAVVAVAGVASLVAVTLGAIALAASLPARYAVIGDHWALLALGLAGAGLALALTQWTLRRRGFATVARARVTQVASQLATQIGAGLAWPAGAGLLAGDVVGRLAGSFVLVRRLWREDRALVARVTRADVAAAAREYREYPRYSAPGALLNTVAIQLPPLLLLSLFGQHVAGWFGLMVRVVSAPMMLVGKSVSDAYASEFSRLMRDNPGGLPGLFTSTFRRLALIGLAPLVVILTAGPWLFAWVFGQDWREAGEYARLAAFYTFAEFCCFPLFLTLNLLKRQRVQLAWDAALVTLLAGGFTVLWRAGAGPRAAVLYYGVCFGTMYFAHVLVSYVLLRRRFAAPRGEA